MPAKIILSITKGKLAGRQFVFESRSTCLIGKAKDCMPRFPVDQEHSTVSRHHCLLDINPPDVRIRDFGSLNGTFVNGKIIGKRSKGQSAEEAAGLRFPEHDLNDGDEIRIGSAIFQVAILVPLYCSICSADIPKDQQARAEKGPGVFQCENCEQQLVATQAEPAMLSTTKTNHCAQCGRDLASEQSQHRQGVQICKACRSDPRLISQHLLDHARSGASGLSALRDSSIIKELGKGGMGAVYLIQSEKTGEQLALKIMLPQVAMAPRSREQFQREIDNTRALKHPNVVELRDTGCWQGTFFLTLEYCQGGSADELRKQRGGKLSVAEAGPLILQALDGLAYAHQAVIPNVKLANGELGPGQGLVHRDVKPQNIFLAGPEGKRTAKLGDYGLAKAFDMAGLSGQTLTGDSAGTPAFMPRQQLIDYLYAKPEVDVWAMAAALYFLLSGKTPRDFSKGDPWKIVLETQAIPIRQREPSVPRKLAELIDRALTDEPAIPFQSAAELKEALQSVLG